MTPPDLAGRDFQRILIIKPSAIGDVVHTLPILNLVRRKWPRATIAWLITPQCAGLIEGHPLLDELIIFDRKRFAGAWKSIAAFKELHRFTKSLRERKFDLVLDLQGLFRSGWLTGKTRAQVRVGFSNAREMAPIFYTHKVPIDTMEQHAIDRYLKLAEFIGCDDGPVEFPFATAETDRQHVREVLGQINRYALLLPGTNWQTKRWPVEKFAALVEPLRQRLGLTSVLAGGPDAAAMVHHFPGAINLAGRTSLRQLCALIESAAVVIANDSGPMHIASALCRPLITLFGPTNPIRTGPFNRLETVLRLDLPCAPCYSRRCTHTSCLAWIDVESVLDAVARQMEAVAVASSQ